MTTKLVTLTSDKALRDAALEMLRDAVHRVLVTEASRLIGVISTLDLAAAVHAARIESPISAWMTSPAVTVEASQPVAEAVDRLARQHLSAVIVAEDGWPVGTFSQVEALAARDLPRDTPVEAVMDSALICLPSSMRVFRAAAHASQLDVRRVIVTMAHEMVGVIGGLDFARIVAG
jgi:predicted transcriptional regulator